MPAGYSDTPLLKKLGYDAVAAKTGPAEIRRIAVIEARRRQ